MKSLIVTGLVACLCGCISQTQIPSSARSTNTWVVTVGMENSAFAGECPGAGVDCERMTKLFGNYSTHVTQFQSTNAIKSTVSAAMKTAAANSDLFIFYYSGHGGSSAFWNTENESDGKDEFLCLFDTYMRDDEIWDICSQAKGRVMLIFDCCHSQTMFKIPCVTMRSRIKLSETHNESANGMSMLVWSGCPDDTYSYGGSSGGQFTNTLRQYFDYTRTYDSLWKLIEADKDLKDYEQVQRTIVGSDFGSKQIFQ